MNIFDKQMVFFDAVDINDIETVKELIKDEEVDPSNHLNYAIINASEKGYTDILKLLLKEDCTDPTDSDFTALKRATKYGQYECILLLLNDRRIDIFSNQIYLWGLDFINENRYKLSQDNYDKLFFEIILLLLKNEDISFNIELENTSWYNEFKKFNMRRKLLNI